MNIEQALIGSLINSIKKEYTMKDAPDFFKLSVYDIEDMVSIFTQFIQLCEKEFVEEFDKKNLEELISYITNSRLFEVYINDMISPYVTSQQRSSFELFKDGLHQMQSMGDLEEEMVGMVRQMTMMLMPSALACSLIMSTYLTLIDYSSGDYGTIDDFLNLLEIKEGQYLSLFQSILRILVNPLNQILQYRLLNPNKTIPMLFVMSMGSLSAKTFDEESESLIKQIEEGIKMTMDKIQGTLKAEEETIN